METLLGVPLDAILAGSAAACILTAAALLLVAARKPFLARLALRNPRRRPGHALLITLGLTLSTVIVSTAFNTGDTVTYTVRSLVASGLGRVDQVVLALPRDQRRSPGQYLGALVNGSLLTGLGAYFPEDQAYRLREAVADDRRIEGMTPAIGEQVTAVNLDQRAVRGQLSLLALPADYPPVFGALRSLDGQTLSLANLAPDELLATADAASQLGAEPGARLELRTRDGPLPYRLRAVVPNGDPAGTQPSLLVHLPDFQRASDRLGRVNQLRVANAGDAATSVRLSAEVARVLRVALADRDAAARLFDLLRADAVRSQVLAAARSADGRERERLEALARTLAEPSPSDEFISLATDPLLERRLFQTALRAGESGVAGIPEVSPLRVLEVKQASQDQADRWGGALTSTFLVMGLFSLASGSLLVFLIFSTLAAERRPELGIARALGSRRGDVIAGFLLEGALYALVASAAGLAIGALLAIGITALGNASLAAYGLQLEPRLEPRSLALSYCLGLLLTFLSIGYSAWRISRLSVVSAIRNLPEPAASGHRRRDRLVAPILTALGIGLLAVGRAADVAPAHALGLVLTLVGLATLSRPLLGRIGLTAARRDRFAYSVCGLALLAYWLIPGDWTAPLNQRSGARGLELFFLGGLSMVLGAVWVAVYNLGGLTGPLVAASGGLRALGLAVRTAAANPLEHRFRTGLTLAMFSLVIFSMVVAGVLLTATHRAYSDPEALAGGFDLRAELIQPARGPDLPAALVQAETVQPEDFSVVGRLATRPAQVVEPGPGVSRWRAISLHEIDAGFVAGLRSPLAARAADFPDDAAVWRVATEQPGFGVLAGPEASAVRPPTHPFDLRVLFGNEGRLQSRQLWVRDERSGASTGVRIVGILDPRLAFPAGLYTSAATIAPTGAPLPQRAAYYLKGRADSDPRQLALGLNLAFAEQGLRASAIGEEVRQIQSVRDLLNQLLQGFFGVGLLAGLAALGVIMLRAVVERRQQIAVLRAIGFRRGMVRLSLLLEASLIATVGIGLGTLLGLALSRRLVEHLGRQYSEIVFGVPWGQIGLIALGAYLAALLLTAAPLWQIGRIEPAEALRSE